MSFNDDEFADFQNCTFEQNKTEINSIDDDDEFADFQDFQDANFVNNNSDNQNLINYDINNKLNDNLKFEIILKDAFPKKQFEQSIDDKQIIILKDLFIDENKRSLWTQIQNLEESPSLKLKWNKTQSFQNFLSSLKINPKNMLNPHVPIFASSTIHFGELLEPTKLNNNEHISSTNSINSINCKQELNSINLDNLSIKQNDKNNSQIEINSLNCFNNINQTNNIDKDKTDQPNGLIKSTSNKLINHIKKVSDNQKKKDESTESNNKILDELPILNFMRSDRIMFNH